jgi:hypothetical protein
MTHLVQEQPGSALIAGVLVVIALVCLWLLTWLVFNASLLWVLVVGWAIAALLPFVIRVVSMRLLSSDETALHQ